MSWVLDFVQEIVNYEAKITRITEAFKKLELTNQQLLEANKKLTQELKEKGDGSKS